MWPHILSLLPQTTSPSNVQVRSLTAVPTWVSLSASACVYFLNLDRAFKRNSFFFAQLGGGWCRRRWRSSKTQGTHASLRRATRSPGARKDAELNRVINECLRLQALEEATGVQLAALVFFSGSPSASRARNACNGSLEQRRWINSLELQVRSPDARVRVYPGESNGATRLRARERERERAAARAGMCSRQEQRNHTFERGLRA